MPESGGLKFLNTEEVFSQLNLQQGMKVACLGCGNQGHFILPAAKLIGREGTAYAVDIQKSVLDSVRHLASMEGLTNVKAVRANLEIVGSTDIPGGSLDAAFLVNVLFQNARHTQMMQEASRLLKSGGKLIVADWKKIGVPFGPAVEHRIDPQEIIDIATALQLKLVLQTEFGQYFWGLIFEKA